MDKTDMVAAVNALKGLPVLTPLIEAMQKTHGGDHLTPTHTAPNGAPADYSIKSFFMARGTVQEQQGYAGSGWAGPKKNYVSVPGYIAINPADEAAIIKRAMQAEEYIVISWDDHVGPKFVFVTGTPAPYAGFDYAPGDALPAKVPLTAIVIRPAPNAKVLSVFAASSDWLDRQNREMHTIA